MYYIQDSSAVTLAGSPISGRPARTLMRTFRSPSTSSLMLQASTRPTALTAGAVFLSAV